MAFCIFGQQHVHRPFRTSYHHFRSVTIAAVSSWSVLLPPRICCGSARLHASGGRWPRTALRWTISWRWMAVGACITSSAVLLACSRRYLPYLTIAEVCALEDVLPRSKTHNFIADVVEAINPGVVYIQATGRYSKFHADRRITVLCSSFNMRFSALDTQCLESGHEQWLWISGQRGGPDTGKRIVRRLKRLRRIVFI